MTSERVRFIVGELKKEPFKKNFTLISFDSLSPQALLQVFADVLGEVEGRKGIDLKEVEDEEYLLHTFLTTLRVLKYQPESDDPMDLRIGLGDGDSRVIHHVLAWMLPRIPELKTRAYLAKYLVKIELPPEMQGDADMEELFAQYEEMMEKFKVSHKEFDSLKTNGHHIAEIRKDIGAMEQEQESVMRKIERFKRQTESAGGIESSLDVIRKFREEREKTRELVEQGRIQSQAHNHEEQRAQRIQRQLKEIRGAAAGATAEGILQRLEQDTEVAKYIVTSKIPKELEMKKKQISIYERVVADTSITPSDIEDLTRKVESVRTQVSEMLMRRMMKTEDDKLLMFRQQTGIVSNRKEATIERLKEAKGKLIALKSEEEEKRKEVTSFSSQTTIQEKDLKDYVKDLRVKSSRYKQLKAELGFLKSEVKLLVATRQTIEEEFQKTAKKLGDEEIRLGMKGFSAANENLEKLSSEKTSVDDEKSKHLEEMTMSASELNERINIKKAELAPLVKNLNSKRQAGQMIGHEHENMKRKFDLAVAAIESEANTIEKEFTEMTKKYDEDQLKFCKLKIAISHHKIDLKRMQDEMKLYTSKNPEKKSYKEKIEMEILSSERSGKKMKEMERGMTEKVADRKEQVQLWKNLNKLLETKKRVAKEKSAI